MKKIVLFIALIYSLCITAQAEIRENFDSSTSLPAGWKVDAHSNMKIEISENSGKGREGDHSVIIGRKSYGAKGGHTWLFTPSMDVKKDKSYEYLFYVKNSWQVINYKFSYGGSQQKATHTNTLFTKRAHNKKWDEIKGNFTAKSTGKIYFAFQYLNKGQRNSGNFYIDAVLIRETPKCTATEKPTVSNVTDKSAKISWAHTATNVADYKVKVVKKDQPVGSNAAAETTVANKTATITGLQQNTEYDVYVKSNCTGTDGKSEWSKKASFKTKCGAVNVLEETFSKQNGDSFLDCWSKLVDKGKYNYSGIKINYKYQMHINNFYSKQGDKLILITPKLNTLKARAKYQLRFKAKVNSSSHNGEKIQVGTITNTEDKSTFKVFKEFTLTDTAKEFTVDFSTYTGTDKYIAFNRSTQKTNESISTLLDYVHWEQIPIWNGTTNKSWENASNWSTNKVPTATDVIIIKNGLTNYPEITNTVSVANITVENGASITIKPTGRLTVKEVTTNDKLIIESDASNSGSFIADKVTGKATYKRYVSDNWQLIGSPVKGQQIANFVTASNLAKGTANTNHRGLAVYNNSKAKPWEYYTSSVSWGNFKDAKGYAIKTKTAGIVSFTGAVNTENITATEKGSANNKFLLLSNPYTAPISANKGTNSFLEQNKAKMKDTNVALYYWKESANKYGVINKSTADTKLAPGQGFFVESKTENNTFNFKKLMLSHQQNSVLLRRTDKPQKSVVLTVSEGNIKGETEIKYLKNTTKGLDIGYDAGYFDGGQTNLGIYSKLADGSYADTRFMLQCVNSSELENTAIPVGIKTDKKRTVILGLGSANLPKGINVFLRDKIADKLILLAKGDTYTVEVNPKDKERFSIHTRKGSSLGNPKKYQLQGINIYQTSNKTLKITGVQEKGSLQVFGISGKMVLSKKLTPQSNTVLLPALSSGVYIATISTKKGTFTNKIIIRN